MTTGPGNGLQRFLTIVAAALTITAVIQAVTLVWWSGRIDIRMDNVEEGIKTITTLVDDLRKRE
jgi:high-affinity Fe2+/Pb2+ permease